MKRWHRLGFITQPLTATAVGIVATFAVLATTAWLGLWNESWHTTSSNLRGPLSADHWLGTNAIGQDIAARAVAGTATAFQVGVIVTFLATAFGAVGGAVAGYYHERWQDQVVSWLMAVLDAVPFYLLVAGIAYATQGAGWALYVALALAFWTTTARLVRAETIKLRELGYVLAARTLGVPDHKIIWRHIRPNVSHLLLIQAAITFVAAIKTEVVLSFLGLGSGTGVSWGQMISESTQDILTGHFANFVVASVCLLALVCALNVLTDALQDWFDPRHQLSSPS